MNGTLYDLIAAWPERRIFAPLRERLLRPLRGDVVEVGAGTGLDFRHYGAAARVLALEPDPAMRRRALVRARDAAARITVEDGGWEALRALPRASADAVVFALVLCTIDAPAALREARRVLRRGGRIVVLEHVRSPGRRGRLQDRVAPLWRAAAGCSLNRDTAAAIAAAGFGLRDLATVRLSPLLPIRDLLVGTAPPLDDER